VLAAEHFLDFAAVNDPRKFFDAVGELFADILALTGPLEQHGKIVGRAFEQVDQLDFFFDTAATLEDFLRFCLVVPEIRGRRASFYLGELFGRTSRFKDSSGDRRRALPGPDTVGSDHRLR
jgi:hypothetical protein